MPEFEREYDAMNTRTRLHSSSRVSRSRTARLPPTREQQWNEAIDKLKKEIIHQ